MEHPNIAAILKDIIQTLEDGKEGYTIAAEATDNPDLRTVLDFYARQRAGFEEDIHAVSAAYGDAGYEEGSSLAGVLHRGWLNIRSIVTAKDPAAILSECERGEDHALSRYQSALSDDLPPDVRAVLIVQNEAIREAHDKIKHLRDLAKAT